jgi:hypothetical protein
VERNFKSALASAEMTNRDLTLQQVGNAPERAVSTARAEDPFIRDERGNPLMVKGTEAPDEATTKVANRMNHAG